MSPTTATAAPPTAKRSIAHVGVPLAILSIVVLLVVPMPPMALDLLLGANLSLAVLILLNAMLIKDSLQFSVFPALLLVTTITRLSINVSSTRSILLNGYAGHVIQAFGSFVVGGNLVVGLVVFLILVVIQFAVITNGAGRVAEVSARFTLDALPGKQMSIDADLNAGIIDETEAKRRRATIAKEADLAGAFDGASKFVKGDAIAAVIIVLINLIGGFAVGVLQHHMSVTDAMQRYSLLSVGDGLVSQIPALLISVAAALVVTRVTGEGSSNLGNDLSTQLLQNPTVLIVAGAAMTVVGLLPGLPTLTFFVIGGTLIGSGIWLRRKHEEQAAAEAVNPITPPQAGDPDQPEILIEQVRVDALRLDLATDLLSLLDQTQAGNLADRVRALRQRIASDLGLLVPAVRTSDDVTLAPSTYTIRVNGVPTAHGEAPAGCALVLTDGATNLPGRPTNDPVFGLPAVWMPTDLADNYALTGHTVIDRASVITTHLLEVIKASAPDLLTRQDVQVLVDAVKEIAPAVAAEVDGDRITLAEIQRVLTELLREGVPITNLARILEAVTAKARENRSTEALVAAARLSIAPLLCNRAARQGVIPALAFEPMLERQLAEAVRQEDTGSYLPLNADTLAALRDGIFDAILKAEREGHTPTIICGDQLRFAIRNLIIGQRPELRILSYPELSRAVTVNPVGEIRLAQHTN